MQENISLNEDNLLKLLKIEPLSFVNFDRFESDLIKNIKTLFNKEMKLIEKNCENILLKKIKNEIIEKLLIILKNKEIDFNYEKEIFYFHFIDIDFVVESIKEEIIETIKEINFFEFYNQIFVENIKKKMESIDKNEIGFILMNSVDKKIINKEKVFEILEFSSIDKSWFLNEVLKSKNNFIKESVFLEDLKKSITLFWVDTETSGTDSNKHQILSIAVIATDIFYNLKNKIYFYIKKNGVSEINPDAMMINKIDLDSSDFINNSFSEKEALDKINEFVDMHRSEQNKVLAQNKKFDISFLEALANRLGTESFLLKYKSIDSLPLFRKLVNSKQIKTPILKNKNGIDYSSSRLEHIAEFFQVNLGQGHNALIDCLTLVECFKKAKKISDNLDYFEVY